jgi:hypothetical protein
MGEEPDKYLPPVGRDWVYIGTCPCNGVDADHIDNDEEWELVDLR